MKMITLEEDDSARRRWLRSTTQERDSGIEDEEIVWEDLVNIWKYLFFVYLVYFIYVQPNPWQVAYHLNKHYTVQKHWHGYFGSENKFRCDFFICCFEFIHCLEGGTIFEGEFPHQVFVLYFKRSELTWISEQ